MRRAKAEEDLRNGIGGNRYGMQEVCPLSGVIINKEESRIRDHKNGRNYRCAVLCSIVYARPLALEAVCFLFLSQTYGEAWFNA